MRSRRSSAWVVAPIMLVTIGVGLVAGGETDAGAHTGVLRIDVSSPTPGAIVSWDRHSVTFVSPTIGSSAPGAAPFTFRVRSTGTVPARIHITQTILSVPFRSLLGPGTSPVTDFTLRRNQVRTLSAGIAWSELANVHYGQIVSVTYTIRAIPSCR